MQLSCSEFWDFDCFALLQGVICDRGLHLRHLMGILDAFYKRLGLEKIRFKPAYNPYTEPSMEIFGYGLQVCIKHHKNTLNIPNHDSKIILELFEFLEKKTRRT